MTMTAAQIEKLERARATFQRAAPDDVIISAHHVEPIRNYLRRAVAHDRDAAVELVGYIAGFFGVELAKVVEEQRS